MIDNAREGLNLMPTTHGRPVFYPELAAYFREIREEVGWTQAEAAKEAIRHGLDAVSRDVLMRLEEGKTKFLEQPVLRGIAQLYGVPYEQICDRFFRAAYGLPCQGSERRSGPDEAPASTRALDIARAEMQRHVADAIERLDAMREELGSVVETLRTHQKPDRARRHQARPRRVHR